jgi:SAM-dependent methyltransferase
MTNLDDFTQAYSKNFAYDFDNRIIMNWYPNRVVSRTEKESSILELGLGHGFATQKLQHHFNRHLVIEGSRSIIEKYKVASPSSNVIVVQSMFEKFESKELFDYILMGFVLEHVEDPILLLKKYVAYLKPGGKLIVVVPNAMSLHRRIGYEAGLLQNYHTLSEQDHELGHKRLYTLESLKRELELAELRTIHIEGIFLKTMTTNQLIKLNLSDEVLKGMCIVGTKYPELSCAIYVEVVRDTKTQ